MGSGPGPGPTCDRNLIVNGEMENHAGWALMGSVHPRYVADPRGGGRSLLVGLPECAQLRCERWSSARQTVSLPADETIVLSLKYRLQVDTPPNIGSRDRSFIMLLTPWDYPMKVWRISPQDTGDWETFSADISQYAGRTVQVYVGTRNDGLGGAVRMLVDDVTLCIR